MTDQPSAMILPFPTRRQPCPPIDGETMRGLHLAEDAIAHLSQEFDIEAENIRHGANLSKGGGILNGRALAWTCQVALNLINLRGNQPADHALSNAIRTWLQARRNAHG